MQHVFPNTIGECHFSNILINVLEIAKRSSFTQCLCLLIRILHKHFGLLTNSLLCPTETWVQFEANSHWAVFLKIAFLRILFPVDSRLLLSNRKFRWDLKTKFRNYFLFKIMQLEAMPMITEVPLIDFYFMTSSLPNYWPFWVRQSSHFHRISEYLVA